MCRSICVGGATSTRSDGAPRIDSQPTMASVTTTAPMTTSLRTLESYQPRHRPVRLDARLKVFITRAAVFVSALVVAIGLTPLIYGGHAIVERLFAIAQVILDERGDPTN